MHIEPVKSFKDPGLVKFGCGIDPCLVNHATRRDERAKGTREPGYSLLLGEAQIRLIGPKLMGCGGPNVSKPFFTRHAISFALLINE